MTATPQVGHSPCVNARSSATRHVRRMARVLLALTTVGVLVWLLHRVGWTNVGAAFAHLGWGGALFLVLVGILENTFDASSFHLALGRRVGVRRMLGYSGIGGLINTLIPWDAGELVKVALIRQHVPLSQAVAGTVVWNYVCKLSRPLVGTAAALIGLLGCAHVAPCVRWTIVGASLLSFLPYLVIKGILHFGAMGASVRLLATLRLLSKESSSRFAGQAVALDEQIREFYHHDSRAYWEMLFHQCLGRVASWLALCATMRLLDLHYSFALSSLLYAGISVATYVYLILPSRLGVGEVAGAGVFVLLGLPFDVGLLVQLIMRVKGLVTLTLASTLASDTVGHPRGPTEERAPEPPSASASPVATRSATSGISGRPAAA
jgi:hypothetical protein